MQPKTHITTYKKHRFSPLDPSPENIDIEDIAHSLSLMCRANGHFTRFFSIARHCTNCCREGIARGGSAGIPVTPEFLRLNRDLLLMLLLHDAAEAYISDLTRPVKLGLHDYVKIEQNLQSVIFKKFKITPTVSAVKTVGEIDDMMLKLEFAHFAGEIIQIQTVNPITPPNFEPAAFEQDEQDFLKLFNQLYKSANS
jgi:hypothetical protein